MSFKKSLEPENKSITSFEVHKTFTLTEADSGSGIYSIPLIKGTDSNLYNFSTSTATSTTISSNTFYRTPTWYSINTLYYRDIKQMRGYIDLIRGVPTNSVGIQDYTYSRPVVRSEVNGSVEKFKLTRPFTRQLHDTANVISIPQELYGESIEPHSFRLTDDATTSTIILQDDGRGNLFDVAHSSSYASHVPDNNNSGSVVGNIFYSDGLVVITQTIYEREYVCVADENEFQHSTNKSLKVGQSGSISTAPLSPSSSIYFKTIYDEYPYNLVGYSTSSYDTSGFDIGTELIGEATHVTSIGLYNDEDELLAVGKMASPIKNEKELSLTFVVRFDTN